MTEQPPTIPEMPDENDTGRTIITPTGIEDPIIAEAIEKSAPKSHTPEGKSAQLIAAHEQKQKGVIEDTNAFNVVVQRIAKNPAHSIQKSFSEISAEQTSPSESDEA